MALGCEYESAGSAFSGSKTMKQVSPYIYAKLLLASVSAPALLWGGAALAQDAQSADETASEGNAIVVTARRIEERIQDVPISVSAIWAILLKRP
jgi:outer membrane receptor protein involved in Fe transport